MHELSIAQDILEIIRLNVPPEDLGQIESVRMKIGEFAGVVADSLQFSFMAITSGTDMDRVKLEITHVPFLIKCNLCGKESTNEFGMMVCECGSGDTEIISGNELKVTEVKLFDREEVT